MNVEGIGEFESHMAGVTIRRFRGGGFGSEPYGVELVGVGATSLTIQVITGQFLSPQLNGVPLNGIQPLTIHAPTGATFGGFLLWTDEGDDVLVVEVHS